MKSQKNKRVYALALLMALSASGAKAQNTELSPVMREAHVGTMTLQQCIEYAVTHNLNIQQQQLNEENKKIQLETTRYSRLPDLSASLSEGFGFGRSTGRDGSTVDNTSASTSFNLSTSMPIFDGFRISNQIKSDKFSLQAASAQLEKARQDISIQVAGYYLNALYYKGVVAIQRQQLELDKKTLQKAKDLFESGKKPESEVAAAQAQVDVALHQLTEAEGNETMARLDLMQALNLTDDVQSFSITDIDTTQLSKDITPAAQVFEQAVLLHPSIMAAKYNLESSKYALKVAKSANLPSLSLRASYSNSYYHQFDFDNMSFGKQLDLNGSEYVGLSLNIPIFNRFATRNSIRQARLQIQNQELQLSDSQLQLQKQIEQAYWNAIKARANYNSAESAARSTQLSFDYESERYAAGKSTAIDLQNTQTKLEKALSDQLQAKYEYLMRVKILEFYNGIPF